MSISLSALLLFVVFSYFQERASGGSEDLGFRVEGSGLKVQGLGALDSDDGWVPKTRCTSFFFGGGSVNMDYIMLASALGSPYVGKLAASS